MGSRGTNIRLNVYNASDDGSQLPSFLKCVGIYHSGVEIEGIEYSFAGVTGIYECQKGDYGPLVESIDLGLSATPQREISKIISELRSEFRGDTYHIILHNCNHFTEALVNKCMHGKGAVPGWVNRAARISSFCKCFMNWNQDYVQAPLSTSLFTGQGNSLSGGNHRLAREDERRIRADRLSEHR